MATSLMPDAGGGRIDDAEGEVVVAMSLTLEVGAVSSMQVVRWWWPRR